MKLTKILLDHLWIQRKEGDAKDSAVVNRRSNYLDGSLGTSDFSSLNQREEFLDPILLDPFVLCFSDSESTIFFQRGSWSS